MFLFLGFPTFSERSFKNCEATVLACLFSTLSPYFFKRHSWIFFQYNDLDFESRTKSGRESVGITSFSGNRLRRERSPPERVLLKNRSGEFHSGVHQKIFPFTERKNFGEEGEGDSVQISWEGGIDGKLCSNLFPELHVWEISRQRVYFSGKLRSSTQR